MNMFGGSRAGFDITRVVIFLCATGLGPSSLYQAGTGAFSYVV